MKHTAIWNASYARKFQWSAQSFSVFAVYLEFVISLRYIWCYIVSERYLMPFANSYEREVFMQAIRVYDYGTPEVLQLIDLPTPIPGEGQILVRIAAIGVNFHDIGVRRGDYWNQPFYGIKLPTPIGREGAGIVESVGPGVSHLHPGMRV